MPLSTSLVTAQGTWAIAVMGGSAASHNNFWQLFVRPTGASRWSLVTPEGVADNGGLVAAGASTSLVVGFRPSQNLAYSPLATSTDTGKNWTPGLLDADLADTPGAIAVSPSGRTLALLQDGTITTAPTASAAAAGQWTPLTTRERAGGVRPGSLLRADGRESPSRSVPIRTRWRREAARGRVWPGFSPTPAVPGGRRGWRCPGRAGDSTVQVLGLAATAGGNVALLATGNSLLAAWWNGTRWTVSAPVAALRGGSTVRALGFGADGSAWLLLGGGRAETIAGTGGSWQALPPVPSGTITLAPPGTATLAPGTGRRVRRAGRLGIQAHRLAARPGSLGEGPADHRADRVRLLELGGP